MSSNMYIRNPKEDQDKEIKKNEYNDMLDTHREYAVKSKIYDLSVKDIGDNLGKTFIDMVNEFSLYRSDGNKRMTDYIRILTHDDRLIYVGIIFVIISLLVFFIDVSK